MNTKNGIKFRSIINDIVELKSCYKFEQNYKKHIHFELSIGIAWVALFYGYANTTIASAVIIYNMCPVYVMLAAPMILGEKRNLVQTIVILLSFVGLILIVGMSGGEGDLFGKAMSGISGILYAVIVIINRKIDKKISANKATMIQMVSASVILLPIVLMTDFFQGIMCLSGKEVLLISILGIVHTGIAYSLYFSTYHQMKLESSSKTS